MLSYIVRRLWMQILVLAGVLVGTFLISHLIPGDPASLYAGARATPEVVEKVRHEWGLDRPIHVQFWVYLREVLQGNLGTSLFTHRPVARDIMVHFPATFELVTASMLIILLVGIPVGIVSAVHKDKPLDHISRSLSVFGVSMPIFWLGLLLILLFYIRLGWLPGAGRIGLTMNPPAHYTGLYTVDSLLSGDWDALLEALHHLILPAFTLAFVSLATVVRTVRSSMLDVLGADYIRTARSKGIRERAVLYRHALKNALIPVVTIVGLSYGQLLQGAVCTELIFAWPGMANYAVTSMVSLDFPAIMGVTLVSAIIYTTVNLLVDISYTFIDPRIRYHS